MNAMPCKTRVFVVYGFISIVLMLILSSCDTATITQLAPSEGLLFPLETPTIGSCVECDQATLAAAMTQQKYDADNQAAATAEIVRANAQAAVDSANATLSVAMTQDQNNTNIIVAQIAATAEVARANAQATLSSAGSTQSAALTQDAIRQTQSADLATTNALAVLNQQNKDQLAASTQTAVANNIATQTQSAAATSQWYTDQARQREEQRRGPIAFLWMWCLPLFVMALAVLTIWLFWRRQKLQQAKLRILENPIDNRPSLTSKTIPARDDSPPYLESDIVDSGYLVTTPDDQVHQWLDEVKTKLLDNDKLQSDKKDEEDDSTDN